MKLLIDDRVKYMTIGRFKARAKEMQRLDYANFKHCDEVWQIEEEAVLVPYDLYLEIQAALLERETRQ